MFLSVWPSLGLRDVESFRFNRNTQNSHRQNNGYTNKPAKNKRDDVHNNGMIASHTMCDNLIIGMTLRKRNLRTCALAAAVAFEMLSLRSSALRETTMPLLEAVLNRFTECLAVTSRCDGFQESVSLQDNF
jgi:hypothetical protein